MLTNITLENFKAFQKLDNLKIKPITILCGTNSCGKSSILQSILLMKQTLENNHSSQNLLLNGRYTKLGYFQDIIFRKDEEKEVKLGLSFKNGGNSIFGYSDFGYKQNSVYQNPLSYDYFTEIELAFKLSEKTKKHEISYIHIKVSAESYWETTPKELLGDIIIEHLDENSYKVNWKNININDSYSGETTLPISNAKLFNLNYNFPDNADIKTHKKIANSLINLFDFFLTTNAVLNNIYKKHSYIGPLRGEPEREYIYRDEVLEIGNKGENAAYLYLSEKDKILNDFTFYNSAKDAFEETENISIKAALDKWMTLMKIDNFDAEIINRIIYLSQNASNYDATKVGIADVGFGVSQIFPILLEGLRMEQGGTLMLEQPEIHLHPNLQMQMADYFIAMALSGKNVIAETHSDHVANRLVRRIVEDETSKLKDLIGIYFIKPSENGAIYEEINIDETRGITNWPPDFFDQTANEQMRIMQAGLKKRKNQRANIND